MLLPRLRWPTRTIAAVSLELTSSPLITSENRIKGPTPIQGVTAGSVFSTEIYKRNKAPRAKMRTYSIYLYNVYTQMRISLRPEREPRQMGELKELGKEAKVENSFVLP